MVGVINEPASGNTLAVFAANAAKAGNTTAPATIGGGAIVANTNSNSTSSNSTSSSLAASSTATNIYGNPAPSSTSTPAASSTGSSTSSSGPAISTSKSGAVAIQAVRWSELLGMAVVIGGAALVMQ
jgi:hypothetical protein